MSLAVSLGLGDGDLVDLGDRAPEAQARDAVSIGIRDLDPGERKILARSGCTVYTCATSTSAECAMWSRRRSGSPAMAPPRSTCRSNVDAIDPEDAPGTGTPVWGGITYRETHLATEMIIDRAEIAAIDVVEVDPVLDSQNKTGALAAELLQSVLGKRIL